MTRSLSALTLLLALGACHSRPETVDTVPARAVRVAVVEDGPALAPVVGTGVLSPRDEARLAFKIGGVVSHIHVREGDSVTRGQLLAEVEPTEADNGVQQALAARDKAARDLERGRRLFEKNVITREQFDDLGTAASIADAQYDTARYNRSYAQIVAPNDGIVLRRLGDERELVAPGQPLLILSRAGSGYVLKLGVADREVVRLNTGDAATISFDAFPGRRFGARIVEIGGAADPRSGTFPVELALDPVDGALPAGLIGRATIAAAHDTATRSYVPLSALVEGDSRSTLLFVVDGSTAHERRVSVAFVDGDRAALDSPLPAGTSVVTDGAAYLSDGEAVRVTR